MQAAIEIRGARENNLKNVSLTLPKGQITIFSGVSGSGKSSLVYDTLVAEAQRQLHENFSMFVRSFLPHFPQPDVDALEHLSMAIQVDQARLGGGAHSTVGTVTDLYTVLRLLFSRVGTPRIQDARCFSFNTPQGMCPECEGRGLLQGVRVEDFLDMDRSLNQGAVQVPFLADWDVGSYASCGFFDNDKPLRDFSAEEWELLLHGKDRKFVLNVGSGTMNASYEGIVEKITRRYLRKDLKALGARTLKLITPHLCLQPCPCCHGARLNQDALASRIDGRNIAELAAMEVGALLELVGTLEEPGAAPVIRSLQERLQHMVDIGLDYLSLDRETDTLSGGESQRVKLVKHLSSSLVDVMYVFDEPSVGLHPRDVHRLNELLQRLRDKGNTVLVVEHDPDVLRIADHVVDMGPGAGSAGGEVVYQGSYAGLLTAGTLTGRHLSQAVPFKEQVRPARGHLTIAHARAHNLQDVSVELPLGVLTVITGVAGSGKSSLVHDCFLPAHPEAVVIDQRGVGASSRSTPATYTGLMDDLRKAFARASGADAGLFSFNSHGACDACKGLGVIYVDLAFMDGVKLPCEACEGRRFRDEVLLHRLDGHTISEVLAMTATEALEHFPQKELGRKLRALHDVGLGYVALGQPVSTLSGGECQRLKLASELHREGSLYVLDEPTTGLHMADVRHLLGLMDRLVDGGNTVIVIEHHLDVVRHADWVIDLGPEGGSRGGQVLFAGTPRALREHPTSHTGRHLR